MIAPLPNQRPLFAEIDARDAALDRVLDHAGQDWRANARSVLHRMDDYEVTGEDIRLACEAAGVRPHHHNAWGAFIASLVREGFLIPTGRYVPMKAAGSHARKTQLYRLMIAVVVIGPDDEPERVITQAECDAEYVDGEVVFQTREE